MFANDLDFPKLAQHIHVAILPDIIKQALPDVHKVTSIRTICDAMLADSGIHKATFSEIHKLIRLFLTIQITLATSERAFSTLKRVFTYLRLSMTEQRLNNCTIVHIHKDVVDQMDLTLIAQAFATANEKRRYFGSF